jgi:hypothetical protein
MQGLPLGIILWPTRLMVPQWGHFRTKEKDVSMMYIYLFDFAKV